MNYNIKLKDTDKLINKGREILRLIERNEKRISKKADFTVSGLIGRNFFGDLIRNNKVSNINSSIDRIQQELLNYHKDLLIYDEKIARKIELPAKLSEFKYSRSIFSDISLRTQMRSKELEVQKIKYNVSLVVKKLFKEREKLVYSMKKEEELENFK